jgi:DNA invertase Pin-like site-specific DNA recombinase
VSAQGFELLDVVSEMDVSGGTPLAHRLGLRGAVERVEQGRAEVLVVAYLNRLMRSLAVKDEVVSRIEAAGGAILTVDVGELTNASAGQWLNTTMHMAFSEYTRRDTAERTQGAKERAVAEGIAPFPNIPAGYRRGEDRRTELDPETAPIVAEGFRLRAKGATIREVRDHLRAHGIDLSYHGVQALLGSRFYLGELHFGALVNLKAHPALIDAATWKRAQNQHVPRGRRPKSKTAAGPPGDSALRYLRRPHGDRLYR